MENPECKHLGGLKLKINLQKKPLGKRDHNKKEIFNQNDEDMEKLFIPEAIQGHSNGLLENEHSKKDVRTNKLKRGLDIDNENNKKEENVKQTKEIKEKPKKLCTKTIVLKNYGSLFWKETPYKNMCTRIKNKSKFGNEEPDKNNCVCCSWCWQKITMEFKEKHKTMYCTKRNDYLNKGFWKCEVEKCKKGFICEESFKEHQKSHS